jgi:hypothetical protein
MMLWMLTPVLRPRLTIAARIACDWVRVGSQAMNVCARVAIVVVVIGFRGFSRGMYTL